ncbi:Exosome complex component RRP46 [Paramyrothecium foliicola]|nr:Exosome complex component RRP46 [Paramyrothecium foliicola]
MPASSEPVAELSHLTKADGSATFSYSGYTVTAAVNGPVEAQRRDENPFEAVIDVNVRPAAGVGGTAERQLESIIQAALRQLVPIRNFPRTLIQVTLQILEVPQNVYTNAKILQAQLNLSIIPALLHAAILGFLTGAVPMKSIATAVTLAIPREGEGDAIILHPSPVEANQAKSVHVVGFTSDEELLLAESKGAFSPDEWDKVLQTGQRLCCRRQGAGLDETMGDGGIESASIADFMRAAMEAKSAADLHWK